jgi:Flp pilus assembly protein TadD
MSLINQMLRDLEKRRKKEDRQLPSGEEPAVVGSRRPSRRLLTLLLGGIGLVCLVWLVLENYPGNKIVTGAQTEQIPVVDQTPQIPIVRGKDLYAALQENETMKPIVSDSVSGSRSLTSRQASGQFTATLLNLGVLESIGSTRLLFEFARLPAYQWEFQDADEKDVSIQFQQTSIRPDFMIPELKGPLLERISLQPGNQSLDLKIEASRIVKVKTLELPADPFHGQRLLVEFFYQHETMGMSPVPRDSAPMDRTEKADPAGEITKVENRVSKKKQTVSREEQAVLAYQVAQGKMQRLDYPAAVEALSQALKLNPRMLNARLQLISLLQKLQRDNEAERQLELGLQQHPYDPELRKIYARLLVADGQQQEAVQLLSSEPRPKVSRDLEYHALLAALQQEIGDYKAAVISYNQLLQHRPQEALWWMGLAISYDQSEAFSRAKEAYRQALSLQGLRPDLKDYIRNRLQKL